MILRTEAIVLKRFDYRETSRIATFFTRDYGKVKGVLKGVRKDTKKFGSNIDKFSVNDIVYYKYRNSDLHLISQCDLKGFFFPVREDLQRSIAANYLLELVDSIMPTEEPNKDVFELMLSYLTTLETVRDINKLVHILQVKVLLLSGFRPHIDSCVKCNAKVGGRAKFSNSLGGLVCHDCKITSGPILMISKGTVSTILYIEKNGWKDCLKIGMTAPIKKELKYVLNNFLVYHLGKKLKSEKFMK